MKRVVALFLSVLLIAPNSLVGTTGPAPFEGAMELIQKSYLDLLELDAIRKFSENEIKTVEDQLKKEKEAEQSRLKKEEGRIEEQLKAARKRLEELNKKALARRR